MNAIKRGGVLREAWLGVLGGVMVLLFVVFAGITLGVVGVLEVTAIMLVLMAAMVGLGFLVPWWGSRTKKS